MGARRAILSVGYSLLGAGLGIAGASNMMDDLPPDEVTAAAFGLGCIGAGMIVVARYVLSKPDDPPESPPDQPATQS
jgi:hypothetical protein